MGGEGEACEARGGGDEVRVMTGELEGGMQRGSGGADGPISTAEDGAWSTWCGERGVDDVWCVGCVVGRREVWGRGEWDCGLGRL